MAFVSAAVKKQQQLQERKKQEKLSEVQFFKTFATVVKTHLRSFTLNEAFHQIPSTSIFSRWLAEYIPLELYPLLYCVSTQDQVYHLIFTPQTPALRQYALQFLTSIYDSLHLFSTELDCSSGAHVCSSFWETLLARFNLEAVIEDTQARDLGNILQHYIVEGNRGGCLLHYLALHPAFSPFLVTNTGHMDIQTAILRLIYSDHSSQALEDLEASKLLQVLVQQFLPYKAPGSPYEVDKMENIALLMRQIIHAPYISVKGVPIYAAQAPILNSGVEENPRLCGATGLMASIHVRKFASRKIHSLLEQFLNVPLVSSKAETEEDDGFFIPEDEPESELLSGRKDFIATLFLGAFQELQFWSTRANPLIQAVGKPRCAGLMVLQYLIHLVETISFTEESGKGQIGIACYDHKCQTHCLHQSLVTRRNPLGDNGTSCYLELNCLLGIRLGMNSLQRRRSRGSSIGAEDEMIQPAKMDFDEMDAVTRVELIALDEIVNAQISDWNATSFQLNYMKDGALKIEHFETLSSEERDDCIQQILTAKCGNVAAIELLCTNEWEARASIFYSLRQLIEQDFMYYLNHIDTLLKECVASISTTHVLQLLKVIEAVIKLQSSAMDTAIVEQGLIATLCGLYQQYPTNSLVHNDLTRVFLFILNDLRRKRSPNCPILCEVFGQNRQSSSYFIDLLFQHLDTTFPQKPASYAAHIRELMAAISKCCDKPTTSAQQAIAYMVKHTSPCGKLRQLLEQQAYSERQTTLASRMIKSNSNLHFPPTQPAFQTELLAKITQRDPSVGLSNLSFIRGAECNYGYLHKLTVDDEWKQVLVVVEQTSLKLWYFYTMECESGDRIRWKWIIPSDLELVFCHGQDAATEDPIGHYGLKVRVDGDKKNRRNLSKDITFSITSLVAREEWVKALQPIIDKSRQLTQEYSQRQLQKLKRLEKCQHCSTGFSLFVRRHECARCRRILCSKCCRFRKSMPECGIFKPVRHCESCYHASGGMDSEFEPVQVKLGSPVIQSQKGFNSPQKVSPIARPREPYASSESKNVRGLRGSVSTINLEALSMHSISEERSLGGLPVAGTPKATPAQNSNPPLSAQGGKVMGLRGSMSTTNLQGFSQFSLH